jgi:RNA polymerase sigma-70 factor (ECF subfamily)
LLATELFAFQVHLPYNETKIDAAEGERVRSDAELVRAAQGGDAASLGVLLERYRAPLYGFALRILGHGPQAEDAVHDAFLVALRKIERVREPAAVGGWLHAVLRNVCLMRLREARGELLLGEPPHHAQEGSFELPVEESIDRLALREWVWTALSELSEPLRVAAMLRYFGSYSSYEEISTILGVPVGTVRSRLNQVKVKLAEALLETAGLAHDEARRLNESQTRFFEAAWGEYNRGQGYELLSSAFSDDPAFVLSDGTIHGRRWFVEEFEGDLEARMKLHLTTLIASKDVTVIEGDYENPSDNPFRCPPAISMVAFYRDGRIPRMHLHFASHPERKDEGELHEP